MRLSNKGFSLVELMVVVAIIGILAAIAVPNFQKFAAKSKQSEAKSNLAALYSAERAFYSEWQQFYGDFAVTGYAPTGKLRYQHGFGAAGPALPNNFTGTANLKGWFHSGIYCPAHSNQATADFCAEITTPIAPALPGGTAVSATAFLAAAGGDLTGGSMAQDQWTIDQNKSLANTVQGY